MNPLEPNATSDLLPPVGFPKKAPTKRRKFPVLVRNESVVVKVYRVRHRRTSDGWAYSLSFVGPDGRHVRQFSRLDRALTEAGIVAAHLATGEAEAATMTKSDRAELHAARAKVGDIPILAALDEWAQARELVGSDLLQACEAWRNRQSKYERLPVAEAVKRFTAAKVASGVTAKTYAVVLGAFSADFGAEFLDAVHARDLEKWLQRHREGWTRNTYRKRVVTLFRWARKQGYLARDVTTEADQTERAKERTPSRALIAADVLARILHALAFGHDRADPKREFDARPELVAAASVSAFCGLRSKEAHRQRWEDINLDDGHVTVSAAKEGTATDRMVELPACAAEWLRLTPAADRVGLLHAYKTDIFTLIRNWVRDTLELRLPANAFRKSWISYRLAAKQDLAAVALEAGHTMQVEVRHYRGLATKAEALAWFSVSPHKFAKRTGRANVAGSK